MDALPPSTQRAVNQSRAIMQNGGGSGPLRVDQQNRYHISQNPDYTGVGTDLDSGQEELLVNKLLGVVLVPTPGDVRPGGWPGVEGVWHDFKDFPAEVGWALQCYLHKPVSLTSLDEMVKDVIIAYREADRPVVDVLLPEQDITSGVVQLIVIESKLARIRVEGVDTDTEEYIRSQMRVRKGEVIRSSEVLHDLAWINRSPYRKVDLAHAPGLDFGTTDIILKPYYTKKDSWFVGYEDSGTELLGNERFLAGFNMGEFFGDPTQSLAYQYTSDWDFEHVHAQSVVYSKDLPWRHNITFLASFADIDTQFQSITGLFSPFINRYESFGFNWQLSMRYNIPLKSKETYLCEPLFGTIQRRRDMAFGFDFKTNDNNFNVFPNTSVPGGLNAAQAAQFLANNQALADSLSNSVSQEIYQFVYNYKEYWQHPKAVSQLDFTTYFSPGNFSQHNTDRTFSFPEVPNSRPGLPSATYAYVNASFEHQRRLIQEWSMRGKVMGQLASDTLLSSEKFGAGGYDRVRGFDQRIILGDEGVYGTFELWAPEISLARIFDWPYAHGPCTDSLRLLAFVDAAAVKDKVEGAEAQSIASVGIGMRYTYNDFFDLRVDWGHPVMTDNVLVQNASSPVSPVAIPLDETGRFHIGATATF